MLQFYGYKKCSTCRQAEKHLIAKGTDYRFIDITQEAPSEAILKKALQNNPLRALFNTSGVVYREQKIKDKLPTLSDSQALKLLAQNGKLVKRPFVTDGKTVTVGFKEAFQAAWG